VAPPALPSRLVDRSRLTAALDGYASGPLTLVSAGPGWGKSVLLSSWAHSRPEPIAWLSLEPADNNPERFWQLVGEAFQAAGLVPDADRFSSLPHCASNASGFIRAFLECVPDPARLVLVVDDAHLLTDATLLAELDALIRYGYPAVSLVMAARSDLLLPLHRYRLADQMHELRAADLAMTRPEAEALLIAHEINLSPPDLDRLTARTEGWAAGLRLSAMSMAGSAHPERFVTQLAHDHGSVAEYLMEEVL
jgi:LuxR family maltose regulon positive regulatory protein